MMEETGLLVSKDGAYAWVETLRVSACGSCEANKGCGVSVMHKLFSGRHHRLRVSNHLDAEVGERVVLGLDENAFVKSSMLLYLMPLLFALGGALLGQRWLSAQIMPADLAAALGGLVGLSMGFAILYRWSRRMLLDPRYQPVMLRRLAEPGA